MARLNTALLGVLAVCILAPVCLSAEEEPDPAEALTQALRALRGAYGDGNYVAASNALERIVALKSKCKKEDLQGAVSDVAKGLRHKDPSIGIVTAKALGKLKFPESAAHLNRILIVPKKPKAERWNFHLSVIAATGELHDLSSVPKLERVLQHDKTDFAVAAAKALSNYKALKRQERVPLMTRLANILGRFEKKKAKTRPARIHLSVVKAALVDCMRDIAKDKKLETADQFRDWVREQEALDKGFVGKITR